MGIGESRTNDGMKWTIICIVFASILVQPSSAIKMKAGWATFLSIVPREELVDRVNNLLETILRTIDVGRDYEPGLVTGLILRFSNQLRIFILVVNWNTNTCNLGKGSETRNPKSPLSGVDVRNLLRNSLVPAAQSLMIHLMGYGYVIDERVSIFYFPGAEGDFPNFPDNDPGSHQHDELLELDSLRSPSYRTMISYRPGTRLNGSHPSLNSNNTTLPTASRTNASRVARHGDLFVPSTPSAYGNVSTNSSSTNRPASSQRRFPIDPQGDCDIFSLVLVLANAPAYDDQSTHGLQMLNPTDKIWSPNTRFYLVMQIDCNLVLYDSATSRPLWSSKTQNRGSTCAATLTAAGELIVYDIETLEVYFRTNTWCSTNGGDCYTLTVLEVQDDGNMVLYIFETEYVLYASNTVQCDGGCEY